MSQDLAVAAKAASQIVAASAATVAYPASPTWAQIAMALVGAIIGIMSEAARDWDDGKLMITAINTLGRICGAAVVGVVLSEVYRAAGPEILRALIPGAGADEIASKSARMHPWVVALAASACAHWLLRVVRSRIAPVSGAQEVRQ